MPEPQNPEFFCCKLLSAERHDDGNVVLEFDTVTLTVFISCIGDVYLAMFELMELNAQ